MKTNFQIRNFIEIEYGGRTFDLHNNFDFIGYNYQPSIKSLTLNWQKTPGDWVPHNEITNFSILHQDVSFLNIAIENGDNSGVVTMDLTDLTFYPSSERETNNCLLDQVSPKEGDDILYIFEDDMFIRVGCSEVLLTF
jgi:hypothetical protein